MKDSKILNFLSLIVAGGFFTVCFIYYIVFDRYLMAYQEQIQLFRFDSGYFAGFLSAPGGLSEYIGTFLIQFFINPIAGSLILTLTAVAVFALSVYIFRKNKVTGILWSLIPAVFLIALQSDYMFNLGYTIGFILVLAFFAIYISIGKEYSRYIFGIFGWILLYPAAGGFSIIATLLCILHELLYSKNRYRFFIISVFAAFAACIPLLFWRTVYYIPIREAWIDPTLLTLREITKSVLILLICYFPFAFIRIRLSSLQKKIWFQPGWNLKSTIAGTLVILALSLGIKNWVYDPNIRLFLEIDQNVQQDKWEKVLELSSKSTISNRLMLYYTNLALYKTGHLEDRMFYYRQIGVPGLWLNREGDELSLFLGGEIFYELGNINEAARWAFDAMVTNGQNPPRLLKQLVLTSLINGDPRIAEKYLNVLDQSLFYGDWVKRYRNYLSHPDLLVRDPEIAAKRHFMIQNDFVARTSDSDIGLKQLLEDHPDNRMAFEYYMLSLLLTKNLNEFAANIGRIKDFGYKEIPVHYEEALLIYMGSIKKNVVPQGYGIRKTTIQRFQNYAKAYSFASQSRNTGNAAESLYGSFGNTYWFYLHFINNRTSSNEASHPFN